MRSVKIDMPKGLGTLVAETCFSVGIGSVGVSDSEQRSSDGTSRPREVVNLETSTRKAKLLMDRLIASDYFDRETFKITLRQPRSSFSAEDMREWTYPLPEPPSDLYQELWQFSHITYGLVGRIFITGCLLAYGLIEQRLLFTIAGLLFLPILPMIMAMSLGITARSTRLALHGLAAFVVSAGLLFVAGMTVAAISGGPMRFTDFSPFGWSLGFSAIVGVAGGLASIDDAGRRELIGLATASQIGIFPVWLGSVLILGAPATDPDGGVRIHVLSFFANTAAILTSTMLVHMLTGMASGIRGVKDL